MNRLNRLILSCLASSLSGCACYTVDAGNRGVLVTLGEVHTAVYQPGFGSKNPFATMYEVSVRQETRKVDAECYSSDLQQVRAHLKVLYRVPETSVISIFRDYAGDPFDSLVAPRVQQALKEVTATMTAEQVVKKRDDVKAMALTHARRDVGELLVIVDLVIENIDLSNELEKAIEQKMVQEQEAAKAKFTQQKAEVEAQIAVVRAEGEAKAIRIRGEALKATPQLIELQIVEKWNGVSPVYVSGSGSGTSMLMPAVK